MQYLWDCAIFLYIYFHAVVAAGGVGPIVTTDYGKVRGKRINLDNTYLRDVNAFLGIPYAAPPTGNLRFRNPLPPLRWAGVLNSTTYGPVCPQNIEITENTSPWRRKILNRVAPYMETMSEDCLKLNIFTPVKDAHRGDVDMGKDRVKAVMVFFHDGNFVEGAGSLYDGSVLASKGDVIVVTINYRLGILGFLSSSDENAPGNFGLQDQILALQWVKDNIRAFGGNEFLVTVFGSGSGAASAQLLAMSNLTVGLIHRVIAQSGTATAPWVFAKEPIKHLRMVTEAFGCNREEMAAIVECLRHVPYGEMVQIQQQTSRYYPAFGPVIDGIVIGEDPLTTLVRDAEIGDENDNRDGSPTYLSGIPFLVGLVKSEAFVLIANDTDERGRLQPSKYKVLLDEFVESMHGENTQVSEQVAMAINFEYTDWVSGKDNPYKIRDGIIEAMTDRLYALPVIENVQLLSRARRSVYLYSYGHRLKNGDSPQWTGAIHGEEIPFVFGAPLVNGLGMFEYNFSKSDALVSLAVITYWANFAKTGDPHTPTSQAPTGIHRHYELKFRFENLHRWPRYDMKSQEFVHIGSSPKIRDFYRSHKLAFWTEYVAALAESANKANPTRTDPLSHQVKTDKLISTTTKGITSESATTTSPTTSTPTEGVVYVELPSLEPGISYNISRENKGKKKNYNTELSAVIAVGCGLLLLNVVGLATVYYVKDAGSAAAAAKAAEAAAGAGRTTVV
ncbi:neuroligin-4, X-linked-like [Glandiceps talaboti]